jgi:IS1 family transposase
MVSHLVFYQLGLVALVWLFLMLSGLWPSEPAAARLMPPKPLRPRCKPSKKPKPFPGLTRKPCCAACKQAIEAPKLQPSPPPPPTIASTRGRRRHVDTSQHFCPAPDCRYGGWLGLGNITSNGHPSGGPWRQLYCSKCRGYFLETHGTPFHGKRVAPDLLVWAVGALAEGLGIRAVARVFEVDPNTVLQWLVEVAEQLQAFSQYFLHDVRVTQVQLDELFALLSAVRTGEVSEAEAIQCLSPSPHWVWTAIDPESKLLLVLDVGERTLAMAQCVVHQVAEVLAPGCMPLFLTDGFKEYTTALLTHYGHWVQPSRRQATGPAPKPRWLPLPGLLYAQVIKTVRRRRLVRVSHRVVFGTLEAVQQVLAACGWQINTAFVERLNLSLRQHVAAIGRRVSTLCKGEEGLHQQLALYHVYYNFCLPHASLRQALPQPLPTHGTGSAKRWQPRTPAMAAGLTDHGWTLREVLLFRVPPWPQPAGGEHAW